MITDVKKHIYPVIGNVNALVNGIKIKQAHAKPRGKTQEGDAGKHVKSIETWIHGHMSLILPNLAVDLNHIFVKFL